MYIHTRSKMFVNPRLGTVVTITLTRPLFLFHHVKGER